MAACLRGLVAKLAAWQPGCLLAGWLAAWLPGWLAACCHLAAWMAGCLPGCLDGWLPGWMSGCDTMMQRVGYLPQVIDTIRCGTRGTKQLHEIVPWWR